MFYGDGGGGDGGGAGKAPDAGDKEAFDRLCNPVVNRDCVWRFKDDFTEADSTMIETGISWLEKSYRPMCKKAAETLRNALNAGVLGVWDRRIESGVDDLTTGRPAVMGWHDDDEHKILIWTGKDEAEPISQREFITTLAHEAFHHERGSVTEAEHIQIENDAYTCSFGA